MSIDFPQIPQILQIPQIPQIPQILINLKLSENIAKTYDQKQKFRNGKVFCKQMKNVTVRHSQHTSQKRKSLFVLKTIKFSTNSTNYTIPQIQSCETCLE